MAAGPIRWGVMSTARFGLRTWIPSVQQCRFGEVAAIASRRLDDAEAAARELGIPKAVGSYEALLDDPDVDAVYIPLPNHLHAEWSIAALEAGKHVLCEKPLAMTAADAEAMGEVAERAGVLLMEGFMYRFHPAWAMLRDVVRSGRIGTLRSVQAWASYFNDDPSNIRNIASAGGGGLYDIGCYPISMARWLFDAEPDAAIGLLELDPELDVDIVAAGLLGFPGGGIASIACSTRTEPDQWVKAYGSDGHASISIPINIPFDLPVQVLVTRGGSPPAAPAVEVIEVPAANQYTLMADAFARAVLDGTPAPTPVSDAVANLRVIEALIAGQGGAAG